MERTSLSSNRIAIPLQRADEDLALAVGDEHCNHRIAFIDAHRDDAAGAGIAEPGQRRPLDDASASCP